MNLSFIIPAFNEEKYILDCLQQINAAVVACSQGRDVSAERIVVDNNSTDETAAIAEDAGATVVFEPVNQISRARNAGAATATGDWLIFIDADSHMPAELLADVLNLIAAGEHIACGSTMLMPNTPQPWGFAIAAWSWISKTLHWAAGSFVACRADVFAEIGGFSEEVYVTEEISFSRKAKRYAKQHGKKFEVLTEHPLITSGRKAELYTQRELFMQTLRLAFSPRKTPKDKAKLDVWYNGRR